MWLAYGAHAACTAEALRRRAFTLPLPPASAAAGAWVSSAGIALCLAGMRRFSGAGELTGTRAEDLITSGIYRYSRNPQYLGYVLALTGASIARRSGLGMILATVLAAVYRQWVPMEEEHLDRVLGSRYQDYRRHAPRWLGRPSQTRPAR